MTTPLGTPTCRSRAIVVAANLSVPEDLKSGIATDAILAAERRVGRAVHFGERDRRVFLGQSGGCLFVFRSQPFAVPTPVLVNEYVQSLYSHHVSSELASSHLLSTHHGA